MFKNPFSFHGRIRRTEYGLGYILFLVLLYSTIFIIEKLHAGGFQLVVILSAYYWFLLAQGAKRCHDLSHSGFYQFIPFYFLALIFSEGTNRTNKYGQDPKLVELQEKLEPAPKNYNKLILPETKSREAIASELLSGILITSLAIALLNYFVDTAGWGYFIVESILIMAGYFIILLLSPNTSMLPHLRIYFLIHRAIYSLGCYVVVWSFQVYSNYITDFNFAAIGGDITFIISFFILTYIPYLYYQTRKKQNLIALEA